MATVDKNGKELRVGDVVQFIDTTCIGNAWPEIGKIYTIAGIEDSSAYYQTLLRFKETPKQCFSFRVKKVEKPIEQEPNTANEFKPDGGPSQEELKEYFRYEDGELIRIKTSTTRPDTLGKPFGGMTSTGYIQGWFKNKLYYLHHLIWIYHNGTLPEVIDHINRDKTDNRIENLREATKQENTFNRAGNYDAVSKFKGVSKKRDKWRARITVDGIEHSLGSFDTEIEAGLAYKQAAKLLQGEYSID